MEETKQNKTTMEETRTQFLRATASSQKNTKELI